MSRALEVEMEVMLSVRAELGRLIDYKPSSYSASRKGNKRSTKAPSVDVFSQSRRNGAWCPPSSSGASGSGIKEERASINVIDSNKNINMEVGSSCDGANGIVGEVGVSQEQQKTDPRRGLLQLVSQSDTKYILLFAGEGESNESSETAKRAVPRMAVQNVVIVTEIEDAMFLDHRHSVALVDTGYLVSVTNNVEYTILKDAVRECATIINLSLRLDSMARDAYFSGYHLASSHLRKGAVPDNGEIERSKAILYDFTQSVRLHDKLQGEFAYVEPRESSTKKGKGGGGRDASSSSPSKKAQLSSGRMQGTSFLFDKIKCVYCDADRAHDPSREFIVHPYCPVTHSKETITMCMPCANNWDKYRSKLQKSEGLILKGEENEELCAICSDTPDQLIMCSFCPRSFCNQCLQRTVTHEMLMGLQREDDADWACMSCSNGYGKKACVPVKNWRRATEGMHCALPEAVVLRSQRTTKEPVSARLGEASTPVGWGAHDSTVPVEFDCASDSAAGHPHDPCLSGKAGEMSEERYFAQYVRHTDAIYTKCTQRQLVKSDDMFYTDDACFLCKDGGDLIECDWHRVFGTGRGKCTCRKVYHEYCLAYSVPDNKTWICPRHYCDGCASMNISYLCKYCPVSACKDCLWSMAKMYGTTEYVELPIPQYGFEDSKDMKHIVCHTCLQMFDRCKLSRSDDGISHDHPVYKAERHRLNVYVDEQSKVGGVMIKGTAPLSMPARGTAGMKRSKNVLGLGGLKRPRGGWGKPKKAGKLGYGIPGTGTNAGNVGEDIVDERMVSITTWGLQESTQGWEGAMRDADDVDEDVSLLATKLSPTLTSPPPQSEELASKSFKIVLTKQVGAPLDAIEDDYQYREQDAEASKDSSILERESTTSGSGSCDESKADKEMTSTSFNDLVVAKQHRAVMVSGATEAATALALDEDEG